MVAAQIESKWWRSAEVSKWLTTDQVGIAEVTNRQPWTMNHLHEFRPSVPRGYLIRACSPANPSSVAKGFASRDGERPIHQREVVSLDAESVPSAMMIGYLPALLVFTAVVVSFGFPWTTVGLSPFTSPVMMYCRQNRVGRPVPLALVDGRHRQVGPGDRQGAVDEDGEIRSWLPRACPGRP